MATFLAWETSQNRDGSTDEQAGQQLQREFEVYTDTVSVDAGDIIVALGIIDPTVVKGASHPTYIYAHCTNITARVDPQHPYRWLVVAVYKEPRPVPGAEINPGGGGAGGSQPTPEDREGLVSGSFRREESYRLTDLDGEVYKNTADDLFENPPPHYQTIGIINVKRWYAAVDFAALKAFENATNSDTVEGFDPHQLLCVGVSWVPKTERGWLGWEVDYTLERKDITPEQEEIPLALWADAITGGWIPTPVLNVGYNEIVGGNSQPVTTRFGGDERVPRFLDTAGAVTATPIYVPFRQHEETAFSGIFN